MILNHSATSLFSLVSSLGLLFGGLALTPTPSPAAVHEVPAKCKHLQPPAEAAVAAFKNCRAEAAKKAAAAGRNPASVPASACAKQDEVKDKASAPLLACIYGKKK
jgi:hypothetical protein